MKLYNTQKLYFIISLISGLLLVTVLALPFAFLGFWWALLIDYVVFAIVIGLFAYQAGKNNKDYDEALDELLKRNESENVDKVF